MKLYYNGVALHDLGELVVTPPAVRYDPPESPQRAVHTLSVRVDAFEPSWEENQDILGQAVAALRTQHGTLLWQDGRDENLQERPVRVLNHNFPDDPNAWGTTHQQLLITFEWVDHNLVPNAVGGTYQRPGGALVNLGQVERFREGVRFIRPSERRSPRTGGTGTVSAGGVFKVDTRLDLANQRAALEAARDTMMAELVEGADGVLIFGGFNRSVRIVDADIDMDQEHSMVRWSLNATFTRFPDESNYAVVDYRLSTREDNETGQVRLSFSGTIDAPSLADASAKLALLRSAVVPADYTRLSSQTDDREVEGDRDGIAFIEMTFTEEYQKSAGEILHYTVRRQVGEQVRDGSVAVVYSGNVRARGSTATVARDAALTKARQLGLNKESVAGTSAVLLDSQETDTDQQRLAAGQVIVEVEFQYSYQAKGATGYLEWAAEINTDTFGAKQETVSGYAVAATNAAAEALYNTHVKTSYAGRVVLSERINRSKRRRDTPTAGTHETRLEFNLGLHLARTTSAEDAARYSLATEQNFQNRRQSTTVSGTVVSSSQANAETYLTSLLAGLGALGNRTSSRRQGEHTKHAGATTFYRLDFSDTYEKKLEGAAGILQCDLAVETQYAGPRLVVQPIPDGPSVVQNTGIQDGTRTVRGTCTAVNFTTADTWVRAQRAALIAGPYERPPRVDVSYDFPAQVEGDLGLENFSAVRINFNFTEILLEDTYDPA